MTNERHEKALEAAEEMMEYGASFGEALKAYLKEGCAVIVPREPTEEMEHAAVSKVKPYHDADWYQVMPKDLFRLAWPAMLSKAPNHFTNGE